MNQVQKNAVAEADAHLNNAALPTYSQVRNRLGAILAALNAQHASGEVNLSSQTLLRFVGAVGVLHDELKGSTETQDKTVTVRANSQWDVEFVGK